MRRIVLLQCNDRFDKYLDVALRTFLMHNDRRKLKLDFLLLDLGLTPEQIKKYGRLAHIRKVENDPRWGRFVQAQARLDVMAEICDAGDMLFQYDADSICLGSVGEWIEQFCDAPNVFSAVSEWPHHLFMQFNSGKPLMKMIAAYPKLGEATFSSRSWNFGFVMMKRNCGGLCRLASNIMVRHKDALPWAEQSAFNAAFYAAGERCLEAPRACNFMLNVHQLKVNPDWSAIAVDGEGGPIRIVHYAGHDVKIRDRGPYLPHEELWLHWAQHAPIFEDLL